MNAIAAAAERTQREPGGHAAMRVVVSSPGQSLTMTGQMTYDDGERSQGVLSTSNLKSDDSIEIEMVADGLAFYIHSDQFGSLPDGAKWMSLDFSSFGLDAPDSSLPTDGDAKGELGLLEAVSGDVQKLGRRKIRGVSTTRYRGTVGVAEQAKRMQEEGADDLATYAEDHGTPLRIEAWIDAGGLVRRMRYVKTEPVKDGEGPTTTDMRVDFFGFGPVPEIEIPDASEVFDATDLAKGEIDSSNSE